MKTTVKTLSEPFLTNIATVKGAPPRLRSIHTHGIPAARKKGRLGKLTKWDSE